MNRFARVLVARRLWPIAAFIAHLLRLVARRRNSLTAALAKCGETRDKRDERTWSDQASLLRLTGQFS